MQLTHTDESLYQVVYCGDLVNGVTVAQARLAVAKLFKASEDAVATFFCGKQIVVKSGISYEKAVKYQKSLKLAGAIAHIVPLTRTPSKAKVEPAVSDSQSSNTSAAGVPSQQNKAASHSANKVTLADVGANLLPLIDFEPLEIDLSHLTLAEVGSLIGEQDSQTNPTHVDISHLSLQDRS